MTDVTLLKSFHLERIEIDVDWEQIKREVTNINILTQSIFFEELFANDSPFRPKTGVVSFDSFISVSLDEFFKGDEILSRRFEENHDLINICW